MEAASGAFSWAGFNTELVKARRIVATLNRGIFQWSGQNTILSKQKFYLQALKGTYNMTGQQATLTFSGVAQVPTWSSTIPTVSFLQGTSGSYNLTQHTTFFNSALHQFTILTGSLPTGITLNPTSGYFYNGSGPVGSVTGVSIRIADLAGDWATRSTAPGVVKADPFETSTKLIAASPTVDAARYVLANGKEANVTLDTVIKPTGRAASWKIAVLSAESSDDGDIGFFFGDVRTFSGGDTVWWSYRQWAPATQRYQPWPTQGGQGDPRGCKTAILSHSSGSNQVNEIVSNDTVNAGIVFGYHQDGSSFPTEEVARVTACSNTDIIMQGSIDRGSNPLTGTNPDTGAAWTACEQDRARYGSMYSARSTASNYRAGFGDPFSGAFRSYPGEWITFIGRAVLGAFGTPTTRYTHWAARDGLAPVKLWDSQNITVGNGPAYNTLWLLPYCTQRVSGGRQVSSRTNNITGVTIHVCGLSTPIGVGTLSYNATNQRFTWAGTGETAGTARGFSSANGILTINVTSGTTTNSYLVIEIAPASLPSSGTTTDTVTIANGRPDTQVNYSEVIISTQIINAPGGFAPVG